MDHFFTCPAKLPLRVIYISRARYLDESEADSCSHVIHICIYIYIHVPKCGESILRENIKTLRRKWS